MKTTLLLCALAANAFAAQPILVRVTPETLAALQKRDPMIRLEKPADGEVKVTRPIKPSIINQSSILHDGDSWTLVPNGSVIYLPASMKARLNLKPIGTLLPWTKFLTKNKNWIATNEVSFDQAAGKEPIPAKSTGVWTKQDKIVVAVHQDGPISVRLADESNQALAQR